MLPYSTCVVIFFATALLFSCTDPSREQDLSQLAHTVRSMQKSVDDISYQMNSYNTDLDILEGRSDNQEASFSTIQKQITTTLKSEQKALREQVSILVDKVSVLERNNASIVADIKQMQQHANTTGTSLSQYKTKIGSLEKSMTVNANKLNDVVNTLNILSTILEKGGSDIGLYTVKSGDSLDKIARKNNTTVEAIMSNNSLTSDLIVVGQTLKIP